jgi:S-DNA-T family DNA segregation ATPase FtsK/SpoIIIE
MPPKSNKLKTNKFKDSPKSSSPKKTEKKVKSSKKKKAAAPRKLDPQVIKMTGFFVVAVSIYLMVAFTSFFVNWFDSNPANVVTRYLGLGHYLNDPSILVRNWTGSLGNFLSEWLVYKGFGLGAYVLAFLLLVWGLHLMVKIKMSAWKIFQVILMGLFWLPLTLGLLFPSHPDDVFGGLFGIQLNLWLNAGIGLLGLILVVIFIPLILILIRFKFTFKRKQKKASGTEYNTVETSGTDANRKNTLIPEDKYNTVEFSVNDIPSSVEQNTASAENQTLHSPEDLPETGDEEIIPETESGENALEFTIEKPREEAKAKVVPGEHKGLDTEFDPTLDLPDFQFPTLDLLSRYDENVIIDREELAANKQKIVDTLDHYNISITKIKATIGPTVTLYEIVPAPGVRIAKIRNLEDDIALSLSAMGIRIIAPIPGKGTVGIEVPNKNPTIVSMRSILESERFQHAKMELPIGLGKTIANESYVVDLAKMPHILMAGATGQGKSVGLNAMITSLLYKKHPAELKFVLVDPKKVELTLYSRIERHYLAKLPDSEEAIITDTRKVVRTLNSLSIEMDNRYELLKDAQVRNIKEYNRKFKARKLNPNHGHRFLPYIVLVVDEFADLITTAGKEVETPIMRLAQLARAVGIHLIIATQRPSVNIITGTIKANFPARIAYRVISKIDSRTILDSGGADQLVGRGDMLLSTGSDLIRLQCAFIDTDEVERITDFIGQQRAYPDALHLPEYYDEESEPAGTVDLNERDPLFEDAARIIVQTQQGSTSLLQRKLKLGYNRAGRIIDQLEAAGIVGPFEGSKAREVRVANEMALEQLLKDLNID